MGTSVTDVVAQAKLAAGKFAGPIKIGIAVQQPSPVLLQCVSAMVGKQAEILMAASELTDRPDLDVALVALKTATDNLDKTANGMADATTIVDNVGSLLGYGTDAVKALRLSAGKTCSNGFTPHLQIFPYPPTCGTCGAPVR
jgi:hypothetical protein